MRNMDVCPCCGGPTAVEVGPCGRCQAEGRSDELAPRQHLIVTIDPHSIAVSEARRQIEHTTDGPLTACVLIGRALDMAKAGGNNVVLLDALTDALWDRGMLIEPGAVETPGS